MLIFYRIIYFFVFIILNGLFIFLPDHLKKWILLRNKILNIPASQSQNKSQKILFHAASGELEYVKSIIRDLKSQRPDLEIYVSYSSPSAEKLFKNISDCVTLFLPLPWDTPTKIKSFLNQLNPDVIVISRTDFWPEFINQVSLQKIPLIAVSLFPNLSSLGSSVWLHFVLKKMSLITVVTVELSKKINTLLNQKINVQFVADTRFDQVIHRLQSDSQFEIYSQKKICVFGSTWPDDELILTQITQDLLLADYQIIWCPHDVSKARIKNLKSQLKNYSTALFSEQKNPYILKSDILIVDQVGFLADFYRYSEFAFIGGSFKSKVHSVMEALCAGSPVIVGPFYKNNPEAIDFKNQGFVFSIKNKNDFLKIFHQINSLNLKPALLASTQKMTGSSQKTSQLILNFIKKTS